MGQPQTHSILVGHAHCPVSATEYEEVSKKKVVSVPFEQVCHAQVAEIPKHTRGPQIRWELAFSSS